MANIIEQSNGVKKVTIQTPYEGMTASINALTQTVSGKADQSDLDTTNTQLADNAIQVELYGAVGDGVNSDSLAFQNAVNKAITTRFPAIKLQHGKTYLIKASDVANYSGVSILGNGATIQFVGKVQFNLQNLTYFNLTDLTILTDTGLTEDATSQSNYAMFYYTDQTKHVLYNIQRVSVKSIATQTPKVARYPYFLTSAYATRGSVFANLVFENMGNPLMITNGDHFSIHDIYGINIETLIYVPSGDTFGINNVKMVNTYAQSLTWIMKNNGALSNGKSTILMESGCDKVNLDNITGEFCIERVIYCQAGNVFANNLLAINTQGFKFCGSSASTAKQNVTVKNLTKNVTDDWTFDSGKCYMMLEMYYVTNADIENILLNNYRSDKLTSVGGNFINLLDGLTHVNINNIKAEINTNQPLFYSTANLDPTKTLSDIRIKNVDVTQYGDSSGSNLLFGCGSAAPTNWINGLTIDTVKISNDDNQILNSKTTRYIGDLFDKKVIGLVLLNIDTGYLQKGNPNVQNSSTYVSDNISKFNMVHSFKANGAGGSGGYESAYYNGYASGGSTMYIPFGSFTQNFYAYYLHSVYTDKIITTYENLTTNAVRMYDAIKTINFDMLMDVSMQWNLAINTTGNSYLIEVESSLGCGKAVINGGTITSIYTTGNCVFTATVAMLRITAVAGSGTDYYININNSTATQARVRVKVTKI